MPAEPSGNSAGLRRLDRHRPLADHVYDVIRRDLLFGELADADRLVEQELAERYTASRTPIREALQRLAIGGFLRTMAGGGYVPRRMSPRDVREIYELRLLLEPQAARLAVEHVTDGQLQELRGLSEASRAALREERPGALPELNTRFHGRLAEASGNGTLARLLRTITERLIAHHIFATGDHERQTELVAGHGAIVDALSARDADAAASAVGRHLEEARMILIATMPSRSTLPYPSVDLSTGAGLA